MSKSVINTLLIILSLLTVVIPNAFKLLVAFLLIILGCISLIYLGFKVNRTFVIFGALGWIITFIYLLIGISNGAPLKAVYQVILIYAISPLLWLLISSYIALNINKKFMNLTLIFLSILASISVFLYIYSYQTFGPSFVEFWFGVDEANAVVTQDSIGIRASVPGSLIFLVSGFLSAPKFIKSLPLRYFVMSLLIIATISSGRNAAIVSIVIGFTFQSIFRMIDFLKSRKRVRYDLVFRLTTSIIFICFFSVLAFKSLFFFYDINLGMMIQNIGSKMSNLSATENIRLEQLSKLLESCLNNNLLGAGHGIEVQGYPRNPEHPWRYELVWIALLHRVGILGTIIYLIPFFFTFFRAGKKLLSYNLDHEERFMLTSLFSVFLASQTNPYLEGIVFHWMFIFPIVFLYLRNSETIRTCKISREKCY